MKKLRTALKSDGGILQHQYAISMQTGPAEIEHSFKMI